MESGRSRAKGSTTVARRILALAGLSLALVACTVKGRPLYVQAAGGQPVAAWRVCPSGPDDGITELELYSGSNTNTSHQTPIWKITAVGNAKTLRVAFGQTPPGFRQDVALKQPLQPDQTFTLIANESSRFVAGVVIFRPEQLAGDMVVSNDDHFDPLGKFLKLPNRDFGC